MQSRWDDEAARHFEGDLAQRVYSSRLLGADPSLVLHGGGNTSVKVRHRTIFGDDEDLLCIKGSGWDLSTIEEAGFAPVRLDHLIALSRLPELTDLEMARELRLATVDPAAPAPSVEAILHAILPYRFVDHTHADALIALTNTPRGIEHARSAYGADVLIVPYVMPGFRLARVVADLLRDRGDGLAGIVLMNHGLFSFGDSAHQSYHRMIELVNRAERYLATHHAWELPSPPELSPPLVNAEALATLRRDMCEVTGTPLILTSWRDPEAMTFIHRHDLCALAQQGPATPDHVIRTKRVPLVGTDVARYAADYGQYFAEHAARSNVPLTPLDPAPRVILDPDLGLVTAGRSPREAAIAGEIYHHTIDIIQRADALETYQALPAREIFEVEYWSLEQAKLGKDKPSGLGGEIALVTGAASGIGRACTSVLREQGAAIAALDIDRRIAEGSAVDYLALRCDVTDSEAIHRALDQTVLIFGGLDVLVLNAGVFPAGRPIADLSDVEWERVLRVNLDANLALLRLAYPLLKLSPRGGRVVVIGSKNVPAPGPGAAAYSASKAALTQLARVAALEWGADNIRINVVHPNAVFDTGIWTEDVLRDRAGRYGLTVEQYKRHNILRTEVTSRDVAHLVAALCGPAFAKTTGAQIPIDGGNERVI